MYRTNLRKVGGSVMLSVPPALLDLLHLQAGATVGVAVADGRIIVEPKPRPRYTLAELIAQCDPAIEADLEERAWLESPGVGRELI